MSPNQNSLKGLISSGGSRARLPELDPSPATYKLYDLSQVTLPQLCLSVYL